MKASVPIEHAAELLRDATKVTWTAAQLLGWWNEAQRVIQSLVPRACIIVEALELAVNETRQSLPADRTQLFDVTRNLGADGQTPGVPVRRTPRRSLDDYGDNWHSGVGQTAVRQWAYDPRVPTVFWVEPRTHATTAVWVEAVSSRIPPDCADSDKDITILAEYEPAGVNWMMYRCLSRDSEETPNYRKALDYRDTCLQLLQGEMLGKQSSDANTQLPTDPRDREEPST